MKKCPECAEDVQDEAHVCRFCSFRFDGAPRAANQLSLAGGSVSIQIESRSSRFYQLTDAEIVILQEKPGAGRTLIEKVEKYSDVGYAVVLLAPDDIGGKKGEEMHDRARQNVIFELGYFVGKLGRGRVALLYSEGVEIPSDLAGVEYIPYDLKDAWRYRLGKELREAGYVVDLNKL